MANKPIPVDEASPAMNPGDEAPPGTPGAGEDTCRTCHGSGTANGQPCPDCGGTGLVVKVMGGA